MTKTKTKTKTGKISNKISPLLLLHFTFSPIFKFPRYHCFKNIWKHWCVKKWILLRIVNVFFTFGTIVFEKRRNFENCLCHGTDCFEKLKLYKMGSNLFFTSPIITRYFLIFSSYLQLIVRKKFRLDKCFHCLVQTLNNLFCLNIVFLWAKCHWIKLLPIFI